MPNIVNLAIIVTGCSAEEVLMCHAFAFGLGLEPSSISEPGHNGSRSFLVPPCGSGAGRPAETDHRRRVTQFRDHLEAAAVEYVVVVYGDVETPRVIASDSHDGTGELEEQRCNELGHWTPRPAREQV